MRKIYVKGRPKVEEPKIPEFPPDEPPKNIYTDPASGPDRAVGYSFVPPDIAAQLRNRLLDLPLLTANMYRRPNSRDSVAVTLTLLQIEYQRNPLRMAEEIAIEFEVAGRRRVASTYFNTERFHAVQEAVEFVHEELLRTIMGEIREDVSAAILSIIERQQIPSRLPRGGGR